MSAPFGARAATSLGFGFAAGASAYAVLRAIEALSGAPGFVPGAFGVHIAFFWRTATVAFGGGLATLCAFAAAEERFEATTSSLPWAVAAAAAALAAQAIFLP